LPNYYGNTFPATLTSATTTQDGYTVQPVCPGTQVMVGYHFGLKRAACVSINDPRSLVAYIDTFQPVNGMKTCQGGFSPGGDNNAAMNGVTLNDPSRIFRCIH
jgi:hypothetical protein